MHHTIKPFQPPPPPLPVTLFGLVMVAPPFVAQVLFSLFVSLSLLPFLMRNLCFLFVAFHPLSGQVQLQSPERVARHMLHWYRRTSVVTEVGQYDEIHGDHHQFSCYHRFLSVIGFVVLPLFSCCSRC